MCHFVCLKIKTDDLHVGVQEKLSDLLQCSYPVTVIISNVITLCWATANTNHLDLMSLQKIILDGWPFFQIVFVINRCVLFLTVWLWMEEICICLFNKLCCCTKRKVQTFNKYYYKLFIYQPGSQLSNFEI